MKTIPACALGISLAFLNNSCQRSEQSNADPADSTQTAAAQDDLIRENLAKSLTFHVGFDNNEEADHGGGDRKLYSGEFNNKGEQDKQTVQGLGNPPLALSKTGGRYLGALEFTKENTHAVFYKLERNIEFSEQDFSGTFSFWLNCNPEEIPNKYCDPVQLTDKYYASDCIWLDITKNDIPPDSRLGVYGDRKTWDVANLEGRAEEFFWRVLKISKPPLESGTWTHVLITWEGLNTSEIGRAKLYFNGEYAGQSGPIREPFKWELPNVTMRLGTGKFIGLFDDIALFSKALNQEEVRAVYELKTGIRELHQQN